MMKVAWGSDRDTPRLHAGLWQWASAKLFGNLRGFGPCTTMGVFEDGQLVGVMVYHNWDREAGVIEISGVSEDKRWLARHVLWEMFHYPFDQLGCQLIVMRVSERNQQWNGRGLPRLLTAYGFTTTHVPRLFGREEGGILYCLTDDAWRANGFHRQHKPADISPVSGYSDAA